MWLVALILYSIYFHLQRVLLDSTGLEEWTEKVKLLQYSSINDNRAAGEGYNEKKNAGK